MCPLCQRITPAARRLLAPGARVIVAVSGGPDSQALLDCLARLRRSLDLGGLWAVGIDHGLRPEASAELQLAARLAASHGVPFLSRSVVVDRRGNLMGAARRARYAALRRCQKALRATHVAVGHTATDVVETVVMQWARGTGPGGARGIAEKRSSLVRPLLEVPREEILNHLAAHDIAYACDPSNASRRWARPRIRQDILPVLESLNPAYARNIVRSARLAAEEHAWLQRQASRWRRRFAGPLGSLPCEPLRRLPPPLARRVLVDWVRSVGGRETSSGLVDSLLDAAVEDKARAWRCGDRTLQLDRGFLWGMGCAGYDRPVALPGETAGAPWANALRAAVASSEDMLPAAFCGRRRIAIAADRLQGELRLRSWRPGDRIKPFGMAGTVKVGDLFTDAKVPRPLRAQWPLVVHRGLEEEIVWVVGLRRGQFGPILSTTRRIVALEIDGAPLWPPC